MALTDGLIAYYICDENAASTTVADAHSSNTGTASTNTSNLYYTPGKLNSYFDYNGSSERVALPHLIDTATANAFSISAWINPDVLNNFRIFSQDEDNTNRGFQFYIDSAGNLNIYNGIATVSTSSNTISTGADALCIFTYDGSGNGNLYLNNTKTAISSMTFITDTANPGEIASRVFSPSYANGKINNLGFWNRELSTEEASSLWNSSDGLAYPLSIETSPTVTTTGFSLVEETTASVSGDVTDDGGVIITERGVAYGTSPSPTTPTEIVAGTTGAFIANLTGLTEGQQYYARAYATNSIGTSYGADVSFSTKALGPTNFTSVEILDTSIEMSWTLGVGAEKTEIRRKEGSYPTDPADGDQAYFDTGITVIDSPLTERTTYYYRAWGWDENSGYSDDYSDLMLTTTGPFYAQSIILFSTDLTYLSATPTFTLSGTPDFLYLTADGGVNWESITNGANHVFANTGSDLRWKAEGNNFTISNLLITDIEYNEEDILYSRAIISDLAISDLKNYRITMEHSYEDSSFGQSIVTDSGLNEIRSWVAGGSATSPTHSAWGIGTTALSPTDTILEGENQRNAFSSILRNTFTVTFESILDKTQSNGTDITKSGLFNDPTTGELYAETLFGAINKTSLFQIFQTDRLSIL